MAEATFGSDHSTARQHFLDITQDTMRNLPATIRELEHLRLGASPAP